MADKKKGWRLGLFALALVVLFLFAALVPTLWAWVVFWSLTALGVTGLVIYQRLRQIPWNDLVMDGQGAHRRTGRVIGSWLAALIFLFLAAYTRRHLQDAEGALVALAVASAITWYALTGRFMISGKKRP